MTDDDRINELVEETLNKMYEVWDDEPGVSEHHRKCITNAIRTALAEVEKAKPGWGGVTQMLLKQQEDKVHEIVADVEKYKKQTDAQLAVAQKTLKYYAHGGTHSQSALEALKEIDGNPDG